MKKEKHSLMIIDPQNDFCDHRGSLYVDGAFADIKRLATLIAKSGGHYTDIFISLDSHDVTAIFHPGFWRGEGEKQPAPYTAVTREDFARGKWRASSPENQRRAAGTFKIMAEKGLDSIMVWPEHCVVSTWGHRVSDTLREALSIWREATGGAARYIFKGENPYTDQLSVFEGLDDSYPETAFNETLFGRLAGGDSVTFAGEALSHCVGESVLSYMKRLGGEKQRVLLLTDCSSPVGGFDGGETLAKLAEKGVLLADSRTAF